ncbi:hypothetical protein, partial [Gordonia asplenii]|uniref:hypothetical protein n=1 Tax=Gordonia asplenii TaxID=2725283 RepID=UPI001B7D5C88
MLINPTGGAHPLVEPGPTSEARRARVETKVSRIDNCHKVFGFVGIVVLRGFDTGLRLRSVPAQPAGEGRFGVNQRRP